LIYNKERTKSQAVARIADRTGSQSQQTIVISDCY